MIVNLHRADWSPNRHGLDSLRSVRPPTVKRGARGSTYTASLIQAQELWTAANGVSTLASPILRYYALLQAGMAVCAASNLGNDKWRPKQGHGLTLLVGSGERLDLSEIIIKEDGIGAAQTLAAALGSPLLTQEASLSELVAALPGQSLLCDTDFYPPKALKLSPRPYGDRHGQQGLLISDLPTSAPIFRQNPDGEGLARPSLDEVKRLFEYYPSLKRLPDPDHIHLLPDPGEEPTCDIELAWQLGASPSYQEWVNYLDIWTWPQVILTDPNALVLPAVGGNLEAQHPLVTWFLVMYSFSILARYYATQWRRLLDLDQNREAMLLRRLVDCDSLTALELIEHAIETFYSLASREEASD